MAIAYAGNDAAAQEARSAAEKAGIVIGDRILAVGGERITGDQWAAYRATWRARPGQNLDVEIVRADGSRNVAHLMPTAN